MTDSVNADNNKSFMEKEYEEFEAENSWNVIFQRLKNESTADTFTVSNSIARLPQNRNKNRYRDILPYDHSRIVLEGGDADYVNASLLEIPDADRRYILTQGPLSNTVSDFWLMCWQQDCHGVVMLSRLFEKDTAKCFAYYPEGDEVGERLEFSETDMRVTLTKYEDFGYYVVRTLSLERLKADERREVLHFQYLTWPDFGCPHSPGSFLNFLFAIRRAGVLAADCGPCIVHCSAGVGRSGSFCLVDSALRIIERSRTLDNINVRSMLLAMRRSRVGLIQSSDQLRFTYQAIIEGGHALLRLESDADLDQLCFETTEGDTNSSRSTSPTSSSEPAQRISLTSSVASSSAASSNKSINLVASKSEDNTAVHHRAGVETHAPAKRRSNELQEEQIDAAMRKQLREQRHTERQRMLDSMSRKQREHELLQRRWGRLLPYRRQITVGLCIASALFVAAAYNWYSRTGGDSATFQLHQRRSSEL